MQNKVRDIFAQIRSDKRDSGDWHLVNADCSIDELHAKLYSIVSEITPGQLRKLQ